MTTRLHTQNIDHQLTEQQLIPRAIWDLVRAQVTDIQFRRMAKLYGMDGPAMGVREVARSEPKENQKKNTDDGNGVDEKAIRKSRDAVLRKLSNNGYLWVFWLFGGSSVVRDPDTGERDEFNLSRPIRSQGRKSQLDGDGENGDEETNGPRRSSAVPMFGPDDVGVAVDYPDDWSDGSGWHTTELRPGDDRWESDAYNQPSTLEREADGWLAYGEGKSLRDNPHDDGPYAAAWARGWGEARITAKLVA
jgi:hypothetical protein